MEGDPAEFVDALIACGFLDRVDDRVAFMTGAITPAGYSPIASANGTLVEKRRTVRRLSMERPRTVRGQSALTNQP